MLTYGGLWEFFCDDTFHSFGLRNCISSHFYWLLLKQARTVCNNMQMVCYSDPSHEAMLHLDLLLPPKLTTVTFIYVNNLPLFTLLRFLRHEEQKCKLILWSAVCMNREHVGSRSPPLRAATKLGWKSRPQFSSQFKFRRVVRGFLLFTLAVERRLPNFILVWETKRKFPCDHRMCCNPLPRLTMRTAPVDMQRDIVLDRL